MRYALSCAFGVVVGAAICAVLCGCAWLLGVPVDVDDLLATEGLYFLFVLVVSLIDVARIARESRRQIRIPPVAVRRFERVLVATSRGLQRQKVRNFFVYHRRFAWVTREIAR